MSDYLDTEDSDEETPKIECTLSEEEIAEIREQCSAIKGEANTFFAAQDYEAAVEKYTQILGLLKSSNLPMDDVILCNRSASYLALKRYVPASHDALQASNVNPDNWKAHWRHGVAIMHMAQRKFRTKQAVTAFERCAECSTLPENKRGEVQQAIQGGKARLADQDANTPMPDMSNCAPS
jgi:tetratricopeptide (TPR) repeat protein